MISGAEERNNPEMDPFPYPYRGDQEKIVGKIYEICSDGLPLVMESGTGTGKTVSSLAGTLKAALGTGKKIVYLTRTKSQQKQIISEVAKISENVSLLCIGLQGRNGTTCPMMRDDPDLFSGTPEEISKLCGEFKKKEPGSESACPYYDNMEDLDDESYIRMIRSENPMPEEFFETCLNRGICPYELSKRLLPYADIVAAPYPFIFSPNVRRHFVQWLGVSLSGIIVIVDEAHNLPSYLREVMTCEYSRKALQSAESEASDRGNPVIYQNFSVKDITSVFGDCMDFALKNYLRGEDGLLPYGFLQEELMFRLGVSSVGLAGICKGLVEEGERIASEKKSKRKLPRSYIRSFGNYLTAWLCCDENTYVNLIVGGDNPKLEAYCLDPYEAAIPLRDCWASVSMSGTLQPLSAYSAELGMVDAQEYIFSSPFPKENLKIIYVDDVSTNYEELNGRPETYSNLVGYTVRLVRAVQKNSAVFFPSYSLMNRFISDGVPEMIGREIFCERGDMTQSELMGMISAFRDSNAGVLFCVTGGRISEGLDFPGKDMELAIIVGIPFPKPTAKQEALKRYCQYRFGDGWNYAIKIPAARKMRQAIGRLIRSETDRGMAVILDRRASILDGIDAALTGDPVAEAIAFFDEENGKYNNDL